MAAAGIIDVAVTVVDVGEVRVLVQQRLMRMLVRMRLIGRID